MELPMGMLMPLKDMFPRPCYRAEQSYRVDRPTETARGGHFLNGEEPVAEYIHSLFRSLR